ncbi:MAG TPA: YceI family protein [Casimicrobiaceae bacterium]
MKSRSRFPSRPTGVERSRLAARLLLASASCWIAISDATAAPEVFRIDPAATQAEFSVAYFWVTKLKGKFGRTQGTIVLDADARAGSIDFAVDAKSVDTGWPVRDNFIRGESMVDAARHPMVRFRSTELTFDRGRLAGAVGQLTLHEVTRPVAVKVARLECGPLPGSGLPGCGVAVVSSIKRSDFGMSFGLPFVGDDIDLSFHLTAVRVEP